MNSRSGRPLAAFALVAAELRACIHASSTRLVSIGEPGLREPSPDCGDGVPLPPEVRSGSVAGTVVLGYVVEKDGSVSAITSMLADSSPVLVAAAQTWLASCHHRPGRLDGKPVRVSMARVFGMGPPRKPDPGEPRALGWLDTRGLNLTPPEPMACVPKSPLPEQVTPFLLEVTIHRDGRATDVMPAAGESSSNGLFDLARAWLEACPFKPAQDAGGHPVAVRVPFLASGVSGANASESMSFFTRANNEFDPVLMAAEISNVRPDHCTPPRPSTPLVAREERITGMVLVEYIVHADGHVGDVQLKNPTAPRVLFEAVANWLTGCRFTPAAARGKPLAVKIMQPFNFSQR